MKIELAIQPNLKFIKRKQLEQDIERILRQVHRTGQRFSFLVCDNACIKRLNKKYFGKREATDVIAFPLATSRRERFVGEVVVSLDEADRVAAALGQKRRHELLLYFIHGILHLLGYDDRRRRQREIMEHKQRQIFEKIINANTARKLKP